MIKRETIEEIKAVLIEKAKTQDLKYTENDRKADYAYKIIIEQNEINIFNLKTNKKHIKNNINTNAKRIKYLENYIFTDYKIENEDEIFLNEFNFNFGGLFLFEEDLQYGLSCGLTYEITFLRFDLDEIISVTDSSEGFLITSLKINYLFNSISKTGFYLGTGFSFIENFDLSFSDGEDYEYKKTEKIYYSSNSNGFYYAIPITAGIEIFRDKSFHFLLDINLLISLNKLDKIKEDIYGTTTNNW